MLLDCFHPLNKYMGIQVDIFIILLSVILPCFYKDNGDNDIALIVANAIIIIAYNVAIFKNIRSIRLFEIIVLMDAAVFISGAIKGIPDNDNVLGKFVFGIIILKVVRLLFFATGKCIDTCCLKCRILWRLKFANNLIFDENTHPNDTCRVCNLDFANGDGIVLLSCGDHMFHKSCLLRWVNGYSTSCPVCDVCICMSLINQNVLATHKYLLYKELHNVETSQDTCSICLDKFLDESKVSVLNCNNHHHIFHTKCITGWTSRGNLICPVCRTPIDNDRMNMV